MKKFVTLILVMLLLLLSACGNSDNNNDVSTEPAESYTASSEQGNKETAPKYQYVGNYEQEPVYQKIKEIELCKNPDTLCRLLSELYGEEFTYIKMTHKSTADSSLNEYAGYEEPYADFICTSLTMYNASSPLSKVPLGSDTYAFFKSYNESPSFIMDSDATYIVSEYEVKQFDDGTHANSVTSWVISDLFMCLHKYIDESEENKEMLSEAVRYMDYYLEFENLVIGSLSESSGSISKTDTLNPNIDILSVEITGPTMHELNVKYRINNISDKRGVVYLTCSGHAYQDELHFNDENFKNDYRADGCFDYDITYGKDGDALAKFTIFYGYGDFDPYEGWDKEIMATISLLYSEDFGEISSNTIPANEIYPLYFEGEYVGAWTIHESRDLIEISGSSTSIPFSKHNTFCSESGHTVSVELSNGVPLFTIDGIYIGEPTDIFEYDGVTYYDLLYGEHFTINRYPNDEYIRVQNAFDIVGEGDVYMYPQTN